MNNRKLTLTNEAARHPFRRMLPPPSSVIARPVVPRASMTDQAFFVISFLSGFIIFFGMIF